MLFLSEFIPKLAILGILAIVHYSDCLQPAKPFDSRSYEVPQRLTTTLKIDYRQINNGGPPQPNQRAQMALQLPLLGDTEAQTGKLMEDIKEGLKYVFQTKNEWTFAVHGTGLTAMQAILDNLIEPGDKVLVAINGMWGDIMANMSERLDANLITMRKPTDTTFTLEEITTAIKQHKPHIFAIVHGESTSGLYQPLDGIGDVCRREGCLFVSDTTAIIGMQSLLMDHLDLDAAFCSSQKGIGAITGLAPLSLSNRAVERIMRRKRSPRGYQTDLTQQYRMWNFIDKYNSVSLPLLYALREALASIVDEGIDNLYERHANATLQLHTGLEELGLEMYLKAPKDRLVGTTAVNIPTGKDARKIVEYLLARHRVEISTGFGEIRGKVLRFATYGTNTDPVKVRRLIMALKQALSSSQTNIDGNP